MGIAKIYNQKQSGISINGIIQDYYVYAGENISAGDFVEFVNGIGSSISYGSSTPISLNTNQYASVGISAIEIETNRVFIAHAGENRCTMVSLCEIIPPEINLISSLVINSNSVSYAGVSTTMLNSGYIFVTHRYGSGSTLAGSICQVEGNVITLKSTKQLSTLSASGNAGVEPVLLDNNDRLFIAHPYGDTTTTPYYAYGIVISVSGTTITIGTDTQISATAYTATSSTSAVLLKNGNVFMVHSYTNSYYLWYSIISTSNLTLTIVKDAILNNIQYYGTFAKLLTLPNRNIFMIHSKESSYYLHGQILKVTDDNILSAGALTQLSTVAETCRAIGLANIDDTKVLVTHSYSSSYYLYGIVCDINDLVITMGVDTLIVEEENISIYHRPLIKLNNELFLICYSTTSNRNLSAKLLSVDVKNNVPTTKLDAIKYETQVRKATTSDIYGVAKTSGEGGIAGLPSNLVVNGDFSNGTTGWTNSHPSYATMEVIDDNGENALKVTITQSIVTVSPYQSISSVNTTDIYYFCGWTKGVSSNIDARGSNYINLCGSSSTIPEVVENASDYVFTSQRSTVTNISDNIWQRLQLYNRGENAVGNVYYWKDIRCYNLTAFYGAGNEPTKEWCDENLFKEVGHKDVVSIYTI